MKTKTSWVCTFIVVFFAMLVLTVSGCATYNPNMSYEEQRAAEQARMVRLRFYLNLMTLGGQRGSTLGGNIGAAGREAMDLKHIQEQENIRNDMRRRQLEYEYEKYGN
jgi:hypothetical protein